MISLLRCMNPFLAIDTSTEDSFVALFEEKKGATLLPFSGKESSKNLLKRIASLKRDDLSFIGVSIGPGSFTGTRIGVMTSIILSYTLKVPLIPYHALIPFSRKGFTSFYKQGKGVWCYEESNNQLTQILPSQSLKNGPFLVPESQYEVFAHEFTTLQFVSTPFSDQRLQEFLLEKYIEKSFTPPQEIRVIYTQFP